MPCNTPITILQCLILFLTLPLSSRGGTLEGVVVSSEGVLESAWVEAYRNIRDIGHSPPVARSIPGERKGFYRLDLPAGPFWLIARGERGKTPYFSFHGANPITIREDPLWLPFAAVPVAPPVTTSDPTISGLVTWHDRPLAGASVSIYPAESGEFKGLGIATRTTDERGRFSVDLPAGSYRVVARKKLRGHGMGISKGDLFCYAPANPVSIGDEQGVSITIPCYPRDDIRLFQRSGEPVKRQRTGSVRLRETDPAPLPVAALEGVVTDPSGTPLPGMEVVGFMKKPGEPFRMNLLRLKGEILTKSDEKGLFRLPLLQHGSYILIAREKRGVAPVRGERFGMYEGNIDHAVDSRTPPPSLTIVASAIITAPPPPPVTPSTIAGPVTLRDRVIDRDTILSGSVTIEGVVVVGRRATLTILPGTTLLFRPVDRDGDGIGDGEIRVLGRMIAEGTPSQPIRFLSGGDSPRPGDWSYILFFTSPGENRLSHCVISHAFSGVQGHFSRVSLSDSQLSENREGIRFGRAEMTISHSLITRNDIGIRYHRYEEGVLIERNDIVGNGTGIFFIPSGQNRPDFSFDEYVADPPRAAPPVIRFNAIHDNRGANFRHGFRQRYDSPAGENWWGTTDRKAIWESIHDKDDDPELGRVLVDPLLTQRPADCGRRM